MNEKNKIVIFGAGLFGEECRKKCVEIGSDVVAFIDNNPEKRGTTHGGLPVFHFNEIGCLQFDMIVVATGDQTVIKQLYEARVRFSQIKSFYRSEPFFREIPLAKMLGLSESEYAVVADKIDDSYYEKRLVGITCPPKSASRIFESVVELLIKKYGPDRELGLEITPSNKVLPVENIAELLVQVPETCCWRTHGVLMHSVYGVAEILRLKSFILLRHPADLIVANYCHHHGIRDNSTIFSGYVDTSVSIVNIDRLNELNLEDGIDYLINDFFLRNLLSIMTGWLHYRNADSEMVVRYEDYASGEHDVFQRVLTHLYAGESLDDDTKEKIDGMFALFRNSRSGLMHRYPKGYSGKIGVWKDYFTEKNIRNYNRVVESFLAYEPSSSKLRDCYSDLIL